MDNKLNKTILEHFDQIPSVWKDAFNCPEIMNTINDIHVFIEKRRADKAIIYPQNPFSFLHQIKPNDINVIILGQDPYHQAGQAQGIAFAVPNDFRAPPSLKNIFKEISQEYACSLNSIPHDLSLWVKQGVFLLNSSLTVEDSHAASHAKIGWQKISDALIAYIARVDKPKVYLLWGAHAQSKIALIEQASLTKPLIIKTNHPSPLSALKAPIPFIGSGQFKLCNAWLKQNFTTEVQWFYPDLIT